MIGDFRNRRRNYFIKKKFQSMFVVRFCLLVILASLFSGAVVYFVSGRTLTTSFENARLSIKSTSDYILPALALSTLLTAVLVGAAAAALSVIFSHRIAGPLYRMEKDIEEIISGDLRVRITLRKNDEMKAFAANLDGMVQRFRRDMDEIKKTAEGFKENSALDAEAHRKIKGITSKYRT